MSVDLNAHASRLKSLQLKGLAADRAGHQPLMACGWSVNTSRQFLDSDSENSLLAWGKNSDVETAAANLFAAKHVNPSEDRPALHWALRAQQPLEGEAETVRQSVLPALAFARKVCAGDVVGASGKAFKTVIHIGIGGSDFGPRLLADAFPPEGGAPIDLRFCANVDPFDLDRAMTNLDPETTLVIGVSKSFGTEETLYNLARARAWLEAALGDDAAKHLALVTANPDKATAWLSGRQAHLFDMPLSVGGRFSLWSAASLACMIYLGADTFEAILKGANAMDEHAKSSPLETNVPMRLALLDVWNTSFRKKPMRVLLAYANRLRLLPTYLQQLEMESNGKSVGPNGQPVALATAPALWGGEGSVGQHSYHQWLHQGSQDAPCEFILSPDHNRDAEGLQSLTLHALAQAEVLANGRSFGEVKAEEPDLSDSIAAQKVHAGGRPSSFLTHASFDPEALGALIALYEHRTYFAGHYWGLNPFDQWGVERGKTMAARLKPVLSGNTPAEDPVTAALIATLSSGT